MEKRRDFAKRVQMELSKIDAATLLYNENEFWLIQQPYEYLEFCCYQRRLINTAIALPLMRGLHNGTYRKFGIVKDSEEYRLPYYIHCLMVCRMLADLDFGLEGDEEDILLAAALCHDAIEDLDFKNGGRELYELYGLDKRVYDTVRLVSKVKGMSIAEEEAYFSNIQQNKLALLVKLSDRGNNVEDLYNMSAKKTREYIEETKRYFIPMMNYGTAQYVDASDGIKILGDKIMALIHVSEAMAEQYEPRLLALRDERSRLKLENNSLREIFKQVWNEVN